MNHLNPIEQKVQARLDENEARRQRLERSVELTNRALVSGAQAWVSEHMPMITWTGYKLDAAKVDGYGYVAKAVVDVIGEFTVFGHVFPVFVRMTSDNALHGVDLEADPVVIPDENAASSKLYFDLSGYRYIENRYIDLYEDPDQDATVADDETISDRLAAAVIGILDLVKDKVAK